MTAHNPIVPGAFAALLLFVCLFPNLTQQLDLATQSKSQNQPQTGSVLVTVFGTNTNNLISQPIRSGQTSSESLVWISFTCVTAKAPSTTRARSATLALSVVTTRFSLTNAITVDSAFATNLLMSNVPSTGSVSATVFGVSRFSSNRARISSSGAVAFLWTSTSAVSLKSAAGDSVLSLTTILTVALATRSSVTNSISFNSIGVALISSISRVNIGITGSQSVTIIGSNIGRSHFALSPVSTSLGQTTSTSTRWIAISSVAAKSPSSTPPTLSSTALTVFGAKSTVTLSVTFDLTSKFTFLLRGNVPGTGSTSVSLIGVYIGRTSSGYLSAAIARVAGSNPAATTWISLTHIRAKFSAGQVPTSSAVSVSVAAIQNTITLAISYNTIVTFSNHIVANIPATGSTSVSVIGSNIGRSSLYPLSAVSARISTTLRNTVWNSATSLAGKAVSSQIPTGNTIALSIVSVVASRTKFISYDSTVTLSAIVRTNFPGTGSTSATVVGSNVGRSFLSAISASARIGGTSTDGTIWASISSIRAKTSATGQFPTARVSVTSPSSTRTLTSAVSFTTNPTPSSITSRNIPGTGSTSVTIIGATIGASAVASLSAVNTRFSFTVSSRTVWNSVSTLTAKIGGRQAPTTNILTVTIGAGNFASVTNAFSIDSNNMLFSTFVRSNFPGTGSASVTVIGSNVGRAHLLMLSDVCVRLSPSLAAASRWTSYSSIAAKSAASQVPTVARISISVATAKATATLSVTFDAALTLSNAIKSNLPGTGSMSVTLVGNIGRSHLQPLSAATIRLGGTLSVRTVWVAVSAISAKSPSAQIPTGSVVVLTVVAVSGTRTLAVTFDLRNMFVSSVVRTNLPGTGSGSVTVIGTNIGKSVSILSDVFYRVGATANAATRWASLSSIRGKTGGVGQLPSGATLVVSIGNVVNTFSAAVTFNSALILSGVVTTNFPGTGSTQVTVIGSNIGRSALATHSAVTLLIGLSAPQSTLWVSISAIGSKVSLGQLPNARTVVLSIFPARASLTNAVTYNLFQPVSSVVGANLPGTGSASVTIVGTNIGRSTLATSAVLVRYASGTSARITLWISVTTLASKIGGGQFLSGTRLVVSVGQLRTTVTLALSYDANFIVSSFVKSNLPGTGAASVTVVGTNIGRSHLTSLSAAASRLAGTAVSRTTSWVSVSAIVSKTPGGQATALRDLTLTIANLKGSLTLAVSFDANIQFSATVASNLPGTASTSVTLIGSNLGRAHIPQLTAAGTTLGGTISTATRWNSVTALRARTPSAQIPTLASIVVSVASVISTISNALTFNGARVTQFTRMNVPGTGATSVTLIGTSVGRSDIVLSAVMARFGGSASEATIWISSSRVTAKFCGGQHPAERGVVVTSQAKLSVSLILTYNPSFVVSSLVTSNIPGTGHVLVTIIGSNIGRSAISLTAVSVRLGSSLPSSTGWVSVTAVASKSAAAQAPTGSRVGLTIGPLVGTVTNAVSFDAVFTLSSIVGANLPATGSTSVTIIGGNIGRSQVYSLSAVMARIAGTSGLRSVWASVTSIASRSSISQVPMSTPVAISVDRLKLTMTLAVSFDLGFFLSDAARVNAPGTGSISLTLVGGNNIGKSQLGSLSAANVRLTASVAASTRWNSASSLRCKIGGGQVPTSRDVVASVGIFISSLTRQISYNVEYFLLPASSIIRTNFGGTGASSVTLLGSNIGRSHLHILSAVSVLLGGTPAAATLWVSVSTIRGRLPAAQFLTGTSVALTVASIQLTQTQSVSFDLSSRGISSVIFSNLPGTGSASVTILGSNLGRSQITSLSALFSRLSGSVSPATVWAAVSAVTAKSGGAQVPTARNLAMSIASVRVTASLQFSFNLVPVLSALVVSNLPGTGATSVTLVGTNIGRSHLYTLSAVAVRLGVSLGQRTDWVSASALVSKCTGGQFPTGRSVVVSVAHPSAKSTVTLAVSFDGFVLVSDFVVTNIPSTGSASVTIIGVSVGRSHQNSLSAVASRLGGSLAPATRWSSISSLGGKTGTGQFPTGTAAVVSAAAFTGTLSLAISFNLNFRFSSLLATNHVGTGSLSVTVLGGDIGKSQIASLSAMSGRLGGTAGQATRYLSTSALRLKVGAGQFPTGNDVVVTVASSQNSRSLSISFNSVGTLSSVVGTNIPGTGSVLVTIIGSSIGRSQLGSVSEVVARVSATLAAATAWLSVSAMSVKAPSGQVPVGSAVTISVVVARASRSNSVTFNAFFILSSSIVSNLPGTGSTSVTIIGGNIGRSQLNTLSPLMIRLGGSLSGATDWQSVSSITLKSGGGQLPVARAVTLSVAGVRATLSLAASFDAALFLSEAIVTNIPGTGSASVTLVGTNIGRSHVASLSGVRSRVGASAAGVSRWTSVSSLAIKVVGGQFPTGSVRAISVASAVGTLTLSLSFDAVVFPVSFNRVNIPGTGSTSCTVIGTNIGRSHLPTLSAVYFQLGGTVSQATRWVAVSSVRGKISAGQVPVLSDLVLSVSRYISTLSSAASYNTIISVSSIVKSNLPGTGSASVTIIGSNIGRSQISSLSNVASRISNTVSAATLWVSNSAMFSKSVSGQVPAGSAVALSVAFFSQNSRSLAVSYDRIFTLSSMSVSNLAGTGSASVTIVGANIGRSQLYALSALFSRVGGTASDATVWSSVTALGTKANAGQFPTGRTVVVSVASVRVSVTNSVSFDPTYTLSSFLGANIPGTGSVSVTLLGSNLGRSQIASLSTALRTRSAGSISSVSSWVSASCIAGKVAAGQVLTGRNFALTVAQVQATITLAISFDALITFSDFVRSNVAGTGSQSITLLGFGIGRSHLPSLSGVLARVGGSSNGVTRWNSVSAVAAKPGAGQFPTASALALSVVSVIATTTLAISYDALYLSVRQVGTPNIPGTGSTSVTLIGSNIGRSHLYFLSAVQGRIGGSAPAATIWVSVSTASCKTGGGQFPTGSELALSVAGVPSTRTLAITYNSRIPISSLIQTNLPGTGSTSVTIIGSNIGRSHLVALSNVLVSLGSTMSDATLWVSVSAVSCRSTAGQVPVGRTLVLSVGNVRTTATISVTYNSVILLSSSLVSNLPGTGSTSITIVGSNIGRSQIYALSALYSRVSPSTASATVWMATTALSSKIGAGQIPVGKNLALSVAGIRATLSLSMTFDTLIQYSSLVGANLPGTGSTSVTITGSNVGRSHLGPISAMASRVGGSTPVLTLWVSATSLSTKTASAQYPTSTPSVLTVALITASTTRALTFDSLIIPRNNLASNTAGTGSASVTVVGLNIGRSQILSCSAVASNFGSTASAVTLWVSVSSISARTPAGQFPTMNSISLTIAAVQATVTLSITFNSLVQFSSLVGANLPGTGSASVTIIGSNVGRSQLTFLSAVMARVSGSDPMSSVWNSVSAIASKVPAAQARTTTEVVISVTAFIVSRTRSVTYDKLYAISSLVGANIPGTGSVSVTLVGSNIGRSHLYGLTDAFSRVGGTKADVTQWLSASCLSGKMQAGQVITGSSIALSVDAVKVTVTLALTFDAAIVVSSYAQSNLPGTGSVSVTVAGSNIGRSHLVSLSAVKVQIGGTAIGTTAWVSYSSLACKGRSGQVPTGTALGLTVAAVSGSLTFAISYDSLNVFSTSISSNLPGTASTSVTLIGAGIGRSQIFGHSAFMVTVAASAVPASNWASITAIRTKSGSGQVPVGSSLVLSVVLVHSTLSLSVSYNSKIALSTITATNFAGTGAISLTLLGSNIGRSDLTSLTAVAFQMGGTQSLGTSWVADSAIVGRSASGQVPTGRDLVLSVSQVYSSLTKSISYDAKNPISSIVTSNLAATGATFVTIVGSNIGRAECAILTDVFGRIGHTSTLSTLWVSITNLLSKAASYATPSSGILSLSTSTARSTTTAALTFDSFLLTSLVPRTNVFVTGANSVTVLGSTFSLTRGCIIGPTASGMTLWAAVTTLVVKTIAGVRQASGTNVAVTAQGMPAHVQTLSKALSYDIVPLLATSVAPANGPSTGAFSLTVFGNGFGASDLSMIANIGDSRGLASKWISLVQITAKSSAASASRFGGMGIVASVSFISRDTLTASFSFAAPSAAVSRVYATNAATTGSSIVFIIGSNLARSDPSLSVSLARTVSPSTLWRSVSSVSARTPPFSGPAGSLVVSVASLLPIVGTLTLAISVDQLAISSILSPNSPATGSLIITVIGSGASALTLATRVWQTSMQATVWNSVSAVASKTFSGFYVRAALVSTVAMVLTRTSAISVDESPISIALPTNAPSTGAISVTVLGNSIGGLATSLSSSFRIGGDRGGTTAATTVWSSASYMYLKTPIGLRLDRALFLTTNVVISGTLTNCLSFGGAVAASSVTPNNLPTTGSVSITIFGAEIGRGRDPSATGRIGGTASSYLTWTSQTQITAKAIAAVNGGGDATFALTQDFVACTLSHAFTYQTKPISVLDSSVHNAPATGAVTSVVTGAQFSLVDHSSRLRFGFSGAPNSLWLSNTALSCKLGQGSGSKLLISATLANAGDATQSAIITFDVTLASLNPSNVPTTGAVSVTVVGSGPSLSNFSPDFRVSSTAATTTVWLSGSSFKAKVPRSRQPIPTVSATALGSVGTVSNMFSYTPPTFGTFTVANVKQSTLLSSANNTITFELQADIPIESGDLITVSGLVNHNGPASGLLPVLGSNASVVAPSAIWYETGKFAFVFVTPVAANTKLLLSVQLKNPSQLTLPNRAVLEGPFPSLIPPTEMRGSILSGGGLIPISVQVASPVLLVGGNTETLYLVADDPCPVDVLITIIPSSSNILMLSATSVLLAAGTKNSSITLTSSASITGKVLFDFTVNGTLHCPPDTTTVAVATPKSVVSIPTYTELWLGDELSVSVYLGSVASTSTTISVQIQGSTDVVASIRLSSTSLTIPGGLLSSSFTLSQPDIQFPMTFSIVYTITSANPNSFVPPVTETYTYISAPTVSLLNLPPSLYLNEQESVMVSLSTPVPVGSSLTWLITLDGAASIGAGVSAASVSVDGGNTTSIFSITAGPKQTGVLSITLVPQCQSGRLFAEPLPFSILVSLPRNPVATAPETLFTNQAGTVSISLGATVPTGRTITIAVSASGAIVPLATNSSSAVSNNSTLSNTTSADTPQIFLYQNLIVAAGDDKATFSLTAGPSAGDITLSYSITGSGSFAFNSPSSSEIQVTQQSNTHVNSSRSDLYFTEEIMVTVTLATPVPAGQNLTVSLAFAGEASLGTVTRDAGTLEPITQLFIDEMKDQFTLVLTGGTQVASNFSVLFSLSGSAAPGYYTPNHLPLRLLNRGQISGVIPVAISNSASVSVALVLTPAVALDRELTIQLVESGTGTANLATDAIVSIPAGTSSSPDLNSNTTVFVTLLTSADIGSLSLQFLLTGDGAAAYEVPDEVFTSILDVKTIGCAVATSMFVGETIVATLTILTATSVDIPVAITLSSPKGVQLSSASPTITAGATTTTFSIAAGSASGIVSLSFSVNVRDYVKPNAITVLVRDFIDISLGDSAPSEVLFGTSIAIPFELSSAVPFGRSVDISISLLGAASNTSRVTTPLTLRPDSVGSFATLTVGQLLGVVRLNFSISGPGALIFGIPSAFDVLVLGQISFASVDTLVTLGSRSLISLSISPPATQAFNISIQTSSGGVLSSGSLLFSDLSGLIILLVPARASSLTFNFTAPDDTIGVTDIEVDTIGNYFVPDPVTITMVSDVIVSSVPDAQLFNTESQTPIQIATSIVLPPTHPVTGEDAILEITPVLSSANSDLIINPYFMEIAGGESTILFSITTPNRVGLFSVGFLLSGNMAQFFTQVSPISVLVYSQSVVVDEPSGLSVGTPETLAVDLLAAVPVGTSVLVTLGGADIDSGLLTVSPSTTVTIAAGNRIANFTITAVKLGSGQASITYTLSGTGFDYFDAPVKTTVPIALPGTIAANGPDIMFTQNTDFIDFALGTTVPSAFPLTINVTVTGSTVLRPASSSISITGRDGSLKISTATGASAATATLTFAISGTSASLFTEPPAPLVIAIKPNYVVTVTPPLALLTGASATIPVALSEALATGDISVDVSASSGSIVGSPIKFSSGDSVKSFTLTAGLSPDTITLTYLVSGSQSNQYFAKSLQDVIDVNQPPLSLTVNVTRSNLRRREITRFTVTIAPSLPLSPGDTIDISGLPVTVSAMPMYVKHDSKDLVNPSSFDEDSNTLSLVVANQCGAPQPIVLRFRGITPATASGTDVTVTITTGTDSASAVVPARSVKREHSVAEIRATAIPAPLTTYIFTTKTISESSNIQSGLNTLTVTLGSTVDLPAGAKLTISGLLNSATSSTSNLAIVGSDAAAFGSSGSWSTGVAADGTKFGQLILTVSTDIKTSVRPAQFKFTLLNPAVNRTATVVSVDVFGLPFDTTGLTGSVFSASVAPFNTLTATISQANVERSASSNITLSLQPAAQLVAGDTITLTGLLGSDSISTDSLPLFGTHASLFAGRSAVWNSIAGTLILTVATSKTIDVAGNTVVQFILKNPSFVQTARSVRASIGGVTPGLSSAVSGSVLGVGQRPTPAFLTFSGKDSSMISNTDNTMTFLFVSNTDLTVGSTLVLTGFRDIPTKTGVVASSSNTGFISPGGVTWDQGGGYVTIIVSTAAPANTLHAISFTLTSPALFAPNGQYVSISATVGGSTLSARTSSTPVMVTTATFARVTLAQVKQSSLQQGAANTITIRFVVNRYLTSGTVLIVGGLKGAARPISSTLAIQNLMDDTSILGTSQLATWDRVLGVLKLALYADLAPGTLATFSVAVFNGYTALPNNIASLNVTDSTGQLLAAPSILTPSVNDTGTLPDVFIRGSVGGAILEASQASWLVATAEQISTVKCVLCTVSIRLQPSKDLVSGSVLTIQGIVGSTTPSNTALVVDDTSSSEISDSADRGMFRGVAVWSQTAGTLTLTVASGKTLSSKRTFTLLLKTIATPRKKPTLTLSSASFASVAIQSTAFVATSGPTLISTDPTTNSFSTSSIVALVFDQNVVLRSGGSISLYQCGAKPATPITTVSCQSTSVTTINGGSTVSVDFSKSVQLESQLCYYVLSTTDCIASASTGVLFGAVTSVSTLRFYTVSSVTPFTLATTTPAAGATDVAVGLQTVTISFTQAVTLSDLGQSMEVLILDSSKKIVTRITGLPKPDSVNSVVVANSVAQINLDPGVLSTPGETYSILVPPGMIISSVTGLPFVGINSIGGFSFTLFRSEGLYVSSYSPTGVQSGDGLSISLTTVLSLGSTVLSYQTAAAMNSAKIAIYRRNSGGVDPAVFTSAVATIDLSELTLTTTPTGVVVATPIPRDALLAALGPASAVDKYGFYVRVPPGSIYALVNGSDSVVRRREYSGTLKSTDWQFWLQGGTTSSLLSTSPVTGSDVASGNGQSLSFIINRVVDLGNGGYIEVRTRTADNKLIASFSVLDPTKVTIAATTQGYSQITVSPLNIPAIQGLQLYVTVPGTAFSADGLFFSGIQGVAAWQFQVAQPSLQQGVAIVDAFSKSAQVFQMAGGFSKLTFGVGSLPAGTNVISGTSKRVSGKISNPGKTRIEALSDVYDFEPDGISFLGTVTMCLRFDCSPIPNWASQRGLAKKKTDATTGLVVYETVLSSGAVSATDNCVFCSEVTGFSSYIVVNQAAAPVVAGQVTTAVSGTPTGGTSSLDGGGGNTFIIGDAPSASPSFPIIPVVLSVLAGVFLIVGIIAFYFAKLRNPIEDKAYHTPDLSAMETLRQQAQEDETQAVASVGFLHSDAGFVPQQQAMYQQPDVFVAPGMASPSLFQPQQPYNRQQFQSPEIMTFNAVPVFQKTPRQTDIFGVLHEDKFGVVTGVSV